MSNSSFMNLPYTDEQLRNMGYLGDWHTVDGVDYRTFPFDVPISRIGVCLFDDPSHRPVDVVDAIGHLLYVSDLGRDLDVVFVPRDDENHTFTHALLDAGARPFWADKSRYPSTIISSDPDCEPALVTTGLNTATFYGSLGDAEPTICFFEAFRAMANVAYSFEYICLSDASLVINQSSLGNMFGNKFLTVPEIDGGWDTVFGFYDALSFGLLPPLAVSVPDWSSGSYYRFNALHRLALRDFRRRTGRSFGSDNPFLANLDISPIQSALDIVYLWSHFYREQGEIPSFHERFDPRDPSALSAQVEILADAARFFGFDHVVEAYAAGVPIEDLIV